jgi:hypothetical protein
VHALSLFERCRHRHFHAQNLAHKVMYYNMNPGFGFRDGYILGWLIFVWGNFKRKIWLGLGA